MSAAFVRWIRFSAVFGLIGCSASLAWGADEAPVNARIVIREGGDATRVVQVIEDEPKPSAWWLGLVCESANAAQREALKIGDHGVVVQQVFPNSPAAAAGLKENDVVVLANNTPIGDIATLIKAVDEAGGKELKLTILRDGNRETIAVTPARRPAELGGGGPRLLVLDPEAPAPAVAKPVPSAGAAWAIPALVPQNPGVSLPEDMEVVIRKEGKEPARVKVTQGNKTWKTVEGELDMLPAAALPYVRRALGLATAPATSAVPGAPLQFRLMLEGADRIRFGDKTEGQRAAAKVQGEGVIIRLGEGNNAQPEAQGDARIRWRKIEKPEAEKVERAAEKLRELKSQLDKERDDLQIRRQQTQKPAENSAEVTDELRTLHDQLQKLREELTRLRKEIEEQQ